MKLKATINIADIAGALRLTQLATLENIELEIVGYTKNPPESLELTAYQQVVREFGYPFPPALRIPAIKRLRELVGGLGLAEAKAIIETDKEKVLAHLAAGKFLCHILNR